MRVLILGASGMLGSAMFRLFSESSELTVFGTVRSVKSIAQLPSNLHKRAIPDIDVENYDMLVKVFSQVHPDVVVNCIGLVKQLAGANDPLHAIPLNSLLPHRIAALCQATNARFIHISTDCVFSGKKGNYVESDLPDAEDLYGRTKLLGEVSLRHTVTLRTSIIGHELIGNKSLVNWFLAQSGTIKGYTKAIFSGLPTVELATIVRDIVIPNKLLYGLYHVSSAPISKFNLLNLVAETYKKKIEINPTEDLVIDRSLSSAYFNEATGYVAPAWPELIKRMFEFK